MPYEVSMSGGSPWGFRLSGGPLAGKPITISRVTPGGKAAQANVLHGDTLIAINGANIGHLDLTELMERIKLTGWTLHLTLISQDEDFPLTHHKRHSETNITTVSEMERPSSRMIMTPLSERQSRPSSQLSEAITELSRCKSDGRSSKYEISDAASFASSTQVPVSKKENKLTNDVETTINGIKNASLSPEPGATTKGKGKSKKPLSDRMHNGQHSSGSTPTPSTEGMQSVEDLTPEPPPPAPKPRLKKAGDVASQSKKDKLENFTEKSAEKDDKEKEPKKMPDYIRRQLKPPRALPLPKEGNLSWLHNKLKITPKKPNGLFDPGHNLKIAAAAYPCQRIEIEGGPLSATIVHSQYNSPVGMYSANQIVNTLVSTAAATGADVPDPQAFGDNQVDVDKNTAVYKMVHDEQQSSARPAQSRSIQILDAFLEHGREIPGRIM